MKKLFTIILAVTMVMGLAMSAQAAVTVQMTLTAPSIAKAGCEKAGAVTFSFANNTIMTVGDWWYFDLDEGATLCKAIDYFVVDGAIARVATDKLVITDANLQIVDDVNVNVGGSIIGIGAGNLGDGPFKLSGGGAITPAGGNVYLRVKGDAGSRRVYVYVYGSAAGATLTTAAAAAGDVVSLTILNGFAYDGTAAGIAGGTPVAPGFVNLLRKDSASLNVAVALPGPPILPIGTYTTFGTTIPEASEVAVPFVQNSLCINAANFTGNDVYISLNSKNDFLTFSGDSKIAHVAAESLALALCKADLGTTFPIATQGACSFDIEAPTRTCSAAANRITLTTTSPFTGSEAYDIILTSETTGVYFGGAVSVMATTSTQDVCSSVGTAVVATSKNSNASGTEDVAFPSASCTIADTNKVNKVWTASGAINSLNSFNALYFDLPLMMYDKSVIAAGTEVKISANLSKRPCGGAVSASFTLGSFVTTCPTSSGGTMLVYPFMPPMGGLDAWWGGFTATNMSGADGTITFTFMEYDGDKATLTVDVKDGETYVNLSGADLLAAVTVDPANAGTFGDSNLVIKAACSFTGAVGMTFTGNGTEGVGYTAYLQ